MYLVKIDFLIKYNEHTQLNTNIHMCGDRGKLCVFSVLLSQLGMVGRDFKLSKRLDSLTIWI